MRVRIIKTYKAFVRGQVLTMPRPSAELLIKKGVAIYSKDITDSDLKHG